jgi:hypothetical protein
MSRAIDCHTPDTRFEQLECDGSSSMVKKIHVSFDIEKYHLVSPV